MEVRDFGGQGASRSVRIMLGSNAAVQPGHAARPWTASPAKSLDLIWRGEWAEVELYREKGQWGSRPKPGSGIHIIIGYDRAKFIATLTER